MAVILSGANGSLYFSCGVYDTLGKIQGFFPFDFVQGQDDGLGEDAGGKTSLIAGKKRRPVGRSIV